MMGRIFSAPDDRTCAQARRLRPAAGGRSGLRERLRGWLNCSRGTSAVEFALLAPALGFSLLATADLGFGMTERMAMDHALRTGAQSAMEDPGATGVLAAMDTAATLNFAVAGGQGSPAGNTLALSTTRFCACPTSTGTEVSCSTICTGSKPTYIFYRMGAVKTYKGSLMPALTFNRSMQVQIR